MLVQIRAAELTVDHLGRTVKINPGDQTSLVGRLVSIRHKQTGNAATPETETRLELEGPLITPEEWGLLSGHQWGPQLGR
jgi:hypothetical protein